ncbi:outer membrane protein assembly factor BamE [Acidovorax radicis]|uniref:outer membrane protein assembly factor BamE n=1 Tax=Acidovorax radicis TaxID=758826 RepID=UPI001CFC1E83|nr:outer membrane protein assembly factor BamE [Acidovorax radicis]UCV00208.1 outer membrane protein assembly factor BamE [Acidovorax radicis]
MPLNYCAPTRVAIALIALLALAACDPQRISELKEGVSTEADVRDRFGAPENVWDEPGGARTLEYNRQPAGQVNYMITIGPDGHMTALRQVLTPENFARVMPGMRMDEVRRLLGKPAKVTPYTLKNETWADWRFVAPPNQPKAFTVIYGPDQFVLRTQTGDDMDAPEFKGGR